MNLAALVLEVSAQTCCDEQTVCALATAAWPTRSEFAPVQARILAASIERRSNPKRESAGENLWSRKPSFPAPSAG